MINGWQIEWFISKLLYQKIDYNKEAFKVVLDTPAPQTFAQTKFWPVYVAAFKDWDLLDGYAKKKKDFYDIAIASILKSRNKSNNKEFIIDGIQNIIQHLNYKINTNIINIQDLEKVGINPIFLKGLNYLGKTDSLEQPEKILNKKNGSYEYVFAGNNKLPSYSFEAEPNPRVLNITLKATKILDDAGWVGTGKNFDKQDSIFKSTQDIHISDKVVLLSFAPRTAYNYNDIKEMCKKISSEVGMSVKFGLLSSFWKRPIFYTFTISLHNKPIKLTAPKQAENDAQYFKFMHGFGPKFDWESLPK